MAGIETVLVTVLASYLGAVVTLTEVEPSLLTVTIPVPGVTLYPGTTGAMVTGSPVLTEVEPEIGIMLEETPEFF